MVESKEDLRKTIQQYRTKGNIPRLKPVSESEMVPTLRQRKAILGIEKCHWTAKGSVIDFWKMVSGRIQKIVR